MLHSCRSDALNQLAPHHQSHPSTQRSRKCPAFGLGWSQNASIHTRLGLPGFCHPPSGDPGLPGLVGPLGPYWAGPARFPTAPPLGTQAPRTHRGTQVARNPWGPRSSGSSLGSRSPEPSWGHRFPRRSWVPRSPGGYGDLGAQGDPGDLGSPEGVLGTLFSRGVLRTWVP